MGKRKQQAPKHADDAKRRVLQWNMGELAGASGSTSFIDDGAQRTHGSIQENKNSPSLSEELTSIECNNPSAFALQVDTFYQNLAACSCTLTLNSQSSHEAKDKSDLLEFGRYRIDLIEHQDTTPLPQQLPTFRECWLYISPGTTSSMLYFESGESKDKPEGKKRRKSTSRQTEFGIFWFVKLNVPTALLTDLGNRSFWLACEKFDGEFKSLQVNIYGHKSLILHLSFPSEPVRLRAPQNAVQKLMEYFFNIQMPYCPKEVQRIKAHDFFELYENVMEIQRERLAEDKNWMKEISSVNHPCLKPRLRPYQRQSVAWMLRQEKRGGKHKAKDSDNGLHPLYCEVMLPKGIKLYYNRYGGSFIHNRPEALLPLPGGILADEMGLGKTVEVLCCMLLNPRTEVDQPQELPVLVDSPVAEDSKDDLQTILQTPEAAGSAKENQNNEDAYEESSTPRSQAVENSSSSNTDTHSKQVEATSIDSDGKDIQIKTGGIENLLGQINNRSEEKYSCRQESSESQAVKNHVKLSSGYNPLLSDTGLHHTKDDEDVTVLTSSSSVNQNLIDSEDSYIDSSNQLQSDIASQESDSFTAQLETGVVENEEVNDKLAETGGCSLSIGKSGFGIKNQVQQTSSEAHTASSSQSNISNSEPIADSAEGSQAVSSKRKRKSRGYVEYVPVTDDSAAISTYFSIQPAKRQQWFECSCGRLEGPEVETITSGDLHTVKCIECGMSQHAECMNYDLRDPLRGEYLCPHCHAICTTIKSGATLIISPYSICHQWIEEIKKHIKERSIKVFIYTGVSRLGYIQPQVLARQDIVITTYDVLRKELDYANLPHNNSDSGRRFRHPKRFLATPSPMVAVEWWRICLDEAQMVECVTTKTAEMAMRLKAVNRWCVTGTPLMRSVEDIYGLLLFLNVDPLRVQQWFRQLVWEPYCYGMQAPMHHALAQVFWRTAKKDVIDQIDLPVQTEEINWLTFSPVEDHFYRRQYEVYLRSVCGYRQKVQHLQDPSVKLHTLDRKTMNELMSPLFRLRQACCHPQIVRGEFLPLNKAMMTMEELLEHMTKKVKTECEEAHRLIVASLNGMAGLAIIKDKIPEAVEKYREVLRSVEQNKDQFRTDDLQQLHAMHNLAHLLDSKPDGVAPTLRDSQLKEQCEELKTKYMSRTKTNMASSLDALETSQKMIKDLKMKLDSLDGDWWAEVVDMTTQRSIDHDLVFKVKDDLLRTSTTEGTIAEIFNSANGLLYVVDQHLQALTTARVALTDRLGELWRDTSQGMVQAAATCCLRPADQVLKTCLFCKVDELFNEYESKLFLFVERGVTVGGDEGSLAYQVSTKRQGTWADSEVERTLKSILSFYKQNFETDQDILEAAAVHIRHMEALKKEFKTLRSVWLNHREMISAIDELEMATERLRLRGEFEPKPTTKILNVIEATDMFGIQAGCSRDEIVGRNELHKKLGQLLYLTNLAKRAEQGDNCNPDSCPICQSGLGVEWSVLMCGHCFCLCCMRTMIDRTLIGGNIDRRLKCPMCRFFTPVREISYVTTLKKERITVKGSHSTKVQAVIECLIKIKEQDPSAKALVFSLWVSVLDILASALAENKITYKSLHDPNHFQDNLSAFKSDSDLSVLLLPLHVGANGLNLVEANHVLLVEPELNLEEEAQAISRIYRIGQTRPTQIHRFLVRGTIEEKIYHIVKAVRESKSRVGHARDEGVELTVGDITSLIQEPGPEEAREEDEEEERGGGGGEGVEGASLTHSVNNSPSSRVGSGSLNDDDTNAARAVPSHVDHGSRDSESVIPNNAVDGTQDSSAGPNNVTLDGRNGSITGSSAVGEDGDNAGVGSGEGSNSVSSNVDNSSESSNVGISSGSSNVGSSAESSYVGSPRSNKGIGTVSKSFGSGTLGQTNDSNVPSKNIGCGDKGTVGSSVESSIVGSSVTSSNSACQDVSKNVGNSNTAQSRNVGCTSGLSSVGITTASSDVCNAADLGSFSGSRSTQITFCSNAQSSKVNINCGLSTIVSSSGSSNSGSSGKSSHASSTAVSSCEHSNSESRANSCTDCHISNVVSTVNPSDEGTSVTKAQSSNHIEGSDTRVTEVASKAILTSVPHMPNVTQSDLSATITTCPESENLSISEESRPTSSLTETISAESSVEASVSAASSDAHSNTASAALTTSTTMPAISRTTTSTAFTSISPSSSAHQS